MMRIASCLTAEHDPLYLVTAALILATAVTTALLMARKASGRRGATWPLLCGLVLGGGAWSTHFVAMLGYAPELPTHYDLLVALASAVLGILGAGGGFILLCRAGGWRQRAGAGVATGGAIAAMHYLGMAGLHLPGTILWDHGLVALSIGWGIAAAAIGFALLRPGRGVALAVAWVMLAIAGLHFLGMAAGLLLLDTAHPTTAAVVPRAWLAGLVAGLTLVWLATGIAVQVLHARQRRHQRQAEMGRIRALADATLEAIALSDDTGRITDVNARLAALLEAPPEALVGQDIAGLLAPGGAAGGADLLGGRIPVECVTRRIDTAAGPRTVHALRDLRERIASQDRISHLARHDPLTGAANRTALGEGLQALLAEAAPFALFYVDLDRFKAVNDLHGHAQGDRVLVEAVLRLRAQAGRGDMVARLGGDEFVVLAPSIATAQEAARSAERMVGLLQLGLDSPACPSDPVTVSIGVALHPGDAGDAEALLHAADLAMYRAKRDGGDRFAFYHAGMDEETRQAQLLEYDVRHALERGELSLEFQPIAAAPGPDVIGFEALVRWTHSVRGKVSPEVFIGVAEGCGSILGIGEWVLRTACRAAAAWANPLTVAVNVSPVQVQQPGFAAQVEAILRETGLPPHRLEVEVTESLFIDEPVRVTETLRHLRSLGVRIALDDFGTGYSSLATLRNFPFDKLKIDRSFIGGLGSDAQAEAIVRGVLGLANGLGLPVVAEGVETEAQLERLRAEGCDAVQGYLIGRPRPIDAYQALTAETLAAAE